MRLRRGVQHNVLGRSPCSSECNTPEAVTPDKRPPSLQSIAEKEKISGLPQDLKLYGLSCSEDTHL